LFQIIFLLKNFFFFLFRLREIVEQGEDDLDEDETYMRRLAGGLFSLQLVSKNKMFFRVPIP
jgi:hypothetical protein